MKMFLLGALTAIVIAVAAGILLPTFLGKPAYDAFSTTSARVGEEFDGRAPLWQRGALKTRAHVAAHRRASHD